VREGKTHQIDSVIETGTRHGMQTMAAALDELFNRGLIDKEEVEARKGA
jgi:twitching motility protein PilT